MSAFLIDTLLWTGALLALVLLIRRPVAALFGAGAAYALWLLPMARLLMPPLVLPAWLAPAPDPAPQPLPAVLDEAALLALAGSPPVQAPAPTEPATALFASIAAIEWTALLIPLWLFGAAAFLVRRYALYFRMRRELLACARPVGNAGRVRLVETAAADGPVAFGVIDKVVALPPGFMAAPDRAARDLALAHELAHHRGHDLVCNMLVQPLFALHWFNPLAPLGWRALRCDQEAACDARVVARAPRESRAAYAQVIARFATQPRHAARLALAAPMACPVLGDRSIVQRLKSLKMTDISPRRRWTARVLLGSGMLALPLTASISYAQSQPPAAPSAPAVPAAPSAPAAAEAPSAPQPPAAPEAPRVTVTDEGDTRVIRIKRATRGEEEAKDAKDAKRAEWVDRKVYIRNGKPMTPEERAAFEKEMADLRKQLHVELGENGKLHRELRLEFGEHGEMQKKLREKLGEHGEVRREMRIALLDAAKARAEASAALASAPRVVVRCRDGQKEISETITTPDGRTQVFVCNSLATAEAKRAIAAARAEIARTRDLTDTQRAEALRSLDQAERETRAD
jgi:bla regulator protein blaR1